MKEPSSPTDGSRSHAVVVTENAQDVINVDLDRWGRLAEAVLRAEGESGELTLTFVDAAVIIDLKIEYFGDAGEHPTDVLSFPLDVDAMEGDDVPRLLGDVVICPEVANLQASTHAGTFDDEIALLVVHGILHILGSDHESDADRHEMQLREREHLIYQFWHGEVPEGFSFAHRSEVRS
jgi:probable rRNA maturation factor